TGVHNLSWYLRMKPLRVPFKFVDVKLLVENHLNCVFFTYSVMSNYDNKIYALMRQLGELKYGVELEDFHLTMDTPDQDFDLKQSIENLDSFSETYSYNIVKQLYNTGTSTAHPATQGDLKFALVKLGLGDHALDLLEQVQSILTRIGNAVGLVIVLMAGHAHHLNNISWTLFSIVDF
ncbi:hypothetical protein ABZP36_024222, partial [Zizania latifolia]